MLGLQSADRLWALDSSQHRMGPPSETQQTEDKPEATSADGGTRSLAGLAQGAEP